MPIDPGTDTSPTSCSYSRHPGDWGTMQQIGIPLRGKLTRNKSLSSSVLPSISVMVDQQDGTSSESFGSVLWGTRRDSLSAHHLNHAYTCNSVAESHQSYHSHPNLNSDLLQGTMYTRPEKKGDSAAHPQKKSMFLLMERPGGEASSPSNANHIRSSFLSLFTKRR